MNVMDWFSKLALEVIFSTAFGIKADVQTDPDEKLLKKVRSAFSFPFILRILSRIPILSTVLKLLLSLRSNMGYFGKVALEIIRQRRESGTAERQDLMQLMLKAQQESTVHGVSKITDEEIVAQCIAFLLGGHETSMISLSTSAYHLALYPAVQEKLRKCICEYMETNPSSSFYEISQGIEYLACVINETLRVFPPAHQLNRECTQDCVVNGIAIPKGIEIIIPFYTLHHDPDAWDDPEKFDPERFRSPAKETRHPYQFMPFGAGPRICLGMRLALMEVKILLVKILLKYKFVRSPETQVPMAMHAGNTLAPKDGVHLKIESI